MPLWNFTPFGSLPFPLMVGVGLPVVVTGNENAEPTVAVAVGLLVKPAALDTCATLNPPTPFPVAWPGDESPTKVYRGEPLYVTWSAPPGWTTALTMPVTPGPPVGVVPMGT